MNRLILHCLLALSTLVLAAPALASSANGTENALGNAMNPSGTDPGCIPDDTGMNPMHASQRRTPTGWLYREPCEQAADRNQAKAKESGWTFASLIEFGGILSSGDDEAYYFREYADFDDGFTISYLNVKGRNRDTAGYFDLFGGSLGRDDQYLGIEAGRYGSYRVTAHYNQVPHLMGTNARIPYDGVGTGRLTLPDSFPPATGTSDSVQKLLESVPGTDFDVERRRAGFGLQWMASDRLKLIADYNYEDRSGTKAYAGSGIFNFLGPGFGSVQELPQPVDYGTHKFMLATQYRGEVWALNLSYSGSFFNNQVGTLTWDNLFFTPSLAPPSDGSYVPEQGRIDLYPDNDAQHLKGEISRNFGRTGSWTTTVAFGWLRQDDALIPYTISSGQGGTAPSPINYDEWNTLSALPRRSAEAEIDTALFETRIGYSPLRRLRLRASLRYYEEDNNTEPFETYNALTGEYGYIVMDGSLGSTVPFENYIFQPGGAPGSYFHYRNIPFGYDETKLVLGSDWRFRAMTLTGEFEHHAMDRDYREIPTTEDNRLRLIATVRSWERATLRILAEYAERSFDGKYDSNPYHRFYTSELPGYVPSLPDGEPPHTLATLIKYDISEREETVLEGRLNLLLSDTLDGFISLQYNKEDFDARHGRRDDRNMLVNTELSYAPGTDGSWYLHASWQDRDWSQANINDAGVGLGTDPNPGSATYPWANEWFADHAEQSLLFGAGHTRMIGRARLDLSYSWSDTSTGIDYDYASAGALAQPGAVATEGLSYPDIDYTRHVLEADLLVPLAKSLEMRLYYRFDRGKIDDWHFTGLAADPVPGNTNIMLMGLEPQDWTAHGFGVFFRSFF